MSLIIICIALVVFMPLLAKIPLGVAMHKANGYNNKQPRQQQETLSGFGARALAAHKNCYEAIAYFCPTAILVQALNEHTIYSVWLCVAFVVSRLLYLVFYWLDLDKLRSVAWIVGIATIAAHYWALLSV